MRYLRKWQLAFVCLLALGLLPFAPAPRGTAQAPGYTVTDLGTLGGEQSVAFGLDECGRVVGRSQAAAGAPAPFHPFHWNNGVMTDLGTLGGLSGTATALNQGGSVVGYSETAGGLTHAFIRPAAGSLQDLGTLGGPFAEAYDINASGQVVGVSEENSSVIQDRAFIWQSGTGMQGLTATWGTPVRAFGINDAGQVAGAANLNPSGTHAFVTIGGDAKDLGTLGGAVSFATEVNDLGEVVGFSYTSATPNAYRAFRWKDANGNGQSDAGEMLNLGVLPGDLESYAYDLNDNGVVVGHSGTGPAGDNNVTRAFIWTSADGLRDLNAVVQGTGWTFREARGINDRGQIVGTGLNPDGKVHAFLLTPNGVGPSPCDPTPTPSPGTLQFSAAAYSVGEAGGAVSISVSRTGGSDGAVSVGYATSTGGTATAGSDYTATSGTLNFAAGETTKTFSVTILEDTLDEPDETVNLTLSGPGGGAGLGTPAAAVLTIVDNDAAPALSINDVTVNEGHAGTTAATFTVTLSAASGRAVSVNYATADGAAAAGSDYAAAAGTLNFAAGETSKTLTVNVNGDTSNESNETFFVNLSGASNATVTDGQGQGTITNDDTPALSFSQATYPVGESAHFVTVTVTRAGDPAGAVGVSFATSDGTATERRDYTAVAGRLQFAAGETSKTFDVLLTEDAYQESGETINLTLSNPTGGAALGGQPTATVNIAADDNPPPNFNPIDISSDFVRQHYHDFLNREPDAAGLAFWINEIESCGADAQCREVKRINVSAAFFLSIEFQQTGYLVYRTYKAAYGDATSPNVAGTVPIVRLQEFLPDTRSIGDGVVVGQLNWEQRLEANKNAYMAEFVQRQRFLTAFPTSLTAAQFVDKLNQNAGGVLTQAERDNLVAALSSDPGGAAARAGVLRAVSENAALQQNEFRRAFVLMQFYGYLRRNPDDPQDVDFRGWKFWLDKLNDFGGNYIAAEMVKAFLDSIEYRTRFAP